jgi:hypothetical protein
MRTIAPCDLLIFLLPHLAGYCTALPVSLRKRRIAGPGEMSVISPEAAWVRVGICRALSLYTRLTPRSTHSSPRASCALG